MWPRCSGNYFDFIINITQLILCAYVQCRIYIASSLPTYSLHPTFTTCTMLHSVLSDSLRSFHIYYIVTYMHTAIYKQTYIHALHYIYMCIYICIYICSYICIYICIYIYIYIALHYATLRYITLPYVTLHHALLDTYFQVSFLVLS